MIAKKNHKFQNVLIFCQSHTIMLIKKTPHFNVLIQNYKTIISKKIYILNFVLNNLTMMAKYFTNFKFY